MYNVGSCPKHLDTLWKRHGKTLILSLNQSFGLIGRTFAGKCFRPFEYATRLSYWKYWL